MDAKQVIVTGGAGFIGSHLVERLLSEGQMVVVIDDCSTSSPDNLRGVRGHPNLTFLQTKVSECGELRRLARGAQSIYHLAAAVGVQLVVDSPIRTIETNLFETEVILQAASEGQVPLLLTSTSEVYGKSDQPAFDEEDDLLIGPPHLGRWSYACSKLMDEFLAMAYWAERRLPVVIARLFNTVGPRQTGRYGMVLPRFIQAAKRGEPLTIYGDGAQQRCFCYVADTVEALVRLQNCPAARGRIFNVGSTEEISIKNLAELVREIVGSRSSLVYVPYSQAYAPGFEDMRRRLPVIDRLLGTTGFQPQTPLRRIIELTAAVS